MLESDNERLPKKVFYKVPQTWLFEKISLCLWDIFFTEFF